METGTIHPAIEITASTAPAVSGVSVAPGSGGSFANHLQRAMETGQGEPSGLKPAGPAGGSVKQPPILPSGKEFHPTKAAAAGVPVASPILVASAVSPSSGPASPAKSTGWPATVGAAQTGLSWLTAMLPDLLSAKPSNQGASASSSDSSANAARKPAAKQAEPQQGSNAEPASALSREAASAANHPDAARTLAAPSTPVAADASGARLSASASAGPDQRGEKLQDVTQSAESAALSVLAKSTTAGAGAIPSVIDSMTNAVPAVVAGTGKASTVATTAAHSQAPATPQVTTKDAAAAGPSLTQSVATSAGPQAVKPVTGIAADAKNSGSQDAQTKGSGTPAAPSATAATQGGAFAAVSNATQAAANGFPAALSQSAATGSAPSHASAPAQGSASQPTAGEKIAMAMETPVSLPQTTVSAASLLQSQARSEMRVAVQTESMGAVQLHAVLESGKLGASISVVSHEAHTLLNNELPALQQVLTDQNLRIDHLSVINAPMSSGAGAGDGRNFHSGDYTRPQGRDLRWYSAATPAVRSADDFVIPGSARRLSVRA